MRQEGPDFYNLFIQCKCLNWQSNGTEIVQYLRFFKGQDGYEGYLKHYLPMLPADVAAEFKPKPVKITVVATEDRVEAPEEAPVKVKRARKTKSSPTNDAV